MLKQRILSPLAMALSVIFLFSACNFNKTPLTSEEFVEKATGAGYETVDVTNEADSENITAAQFITCDDYKIEFYELIDAEFASSFFSNSKEALDKLHSTKMLSVEMNMPNYNYYTYTAEGTYYLLSRIDNTLLCVIADAEYKDDISDFVKSLGYK